MAFKSEVVEQTMLSCGRSCCLCHRFCGTKIETHHIKQSKDGGDDSLENCIPLCFDCHAEVGSYNPSHPKGRKFSISELKGHRDRWYEKVKNGGIAASDEKILEVDRQLLQRIRERLRSDSEIYFLRNHDFGKKFKFDSVTPFQRYMEDAEYPDAEFLNTTLENLRAELNSSIFQFLDYYGGVIFYIPEQPDWGSMQSHWTVPTQRVNPNFSKDRDTLNKLADKVCKAYDDLIRQGRRILAVM